MSWPASGRLVKLMCGVCGIVWRSGNAEHREKARAANSVMLAALKHRGPDGSGTFESENAILGHTRLSIIDLDGGAQPFRMAQDALALSYNGETYNFHDLRHELATEGASFVSRSDTEVALQAYSRWGETFDHRLNGMYAYALFDGRGPDAILQLGTDPVGIKPLFLFENDDWVIFASELRAVISAMRQLSIEVGVSVDGVSAFLAYGFTPAPLSLVQGITAFGPGSRCRIDLRTRKVSWLPRRARPHASANESGNGSRDAELRDCLQRAVERQIVADVPLGFFLSGGIDSSLLLAMAARMGVEPKSFTIRFTGAGHGVEQVNEADIAADIAKICGSRHYEIAIDASSLLNGIDACFAAMDQPLADPACLPLLALARFARQEVTVCLSGDGGDEVFAGYPRHRLQKWKQHWIRVPSPAQSIARSAARCLPDAPSDGLTELLRKAKVGFSLLDDPHYIRGPFACQVAAQEFSWNQLAAFDASELMDADIDGQLAGQMLLKTDNMTMAASLECRVPFLDLELIELASTMPLGYKMNSASGKLPLRRILRDLLPKSISDRPKHGFRVPLTSWLRGEMASRVRDELTSDLGIIEQILPRNYIASVVDEHLEGRSEHSTRIWALLAINAWMRQSLP
ncbi:MAG: asparagine synthase (glutamine-hydrolyzing) [Sphingorhabdus sp.]